MVNPVSFCIICGLFVGLVLLVCLPQQHKINELKTLTAKQDNYIADLLLKDSQKNEPSQS